MSSVLTAALQGAQLPLAAGARGTGQELATPSTAAAGWGLPNERHARIAARRSFVMLKQRFIAAADDVSGPRAQWLRDQVRQSEEPVDLWLLRGLVDDALERDGPVTERTRRELREALAEVFPNEGQLLPYGARR